MIDTYTNFTEHNDWEGATWHFWLPVSGNEDALEKLLNYLEDNATDDAVQTFSFGQYDLTSQEVDLLVTFAEERYFPQHVRVDGLLYLPAELTEYPPEHWFYKGGIMKLFRPDDR